MKCHVPESFQLPVSTVLLEPRGGDSAAKRLKTAFYGILDNPKKCDKIKFGKRWRHKRGEKPYGCHEDVKD